MIALLQFNFVNGQGKNLFNNDAVHEIHLTFENSNYWTILSNNYDSNYPDVPYIMANAVIDGELVDSIGVRLKGFSSYWVATQKKSIKLDFNEFVSGKKYDGLKKVNLNNGEGDPAVQRDVLCYDIMRKSGVSAPRTAYTKVYLNEEYWGLYLLVEQIDKTFLEDNFGTKEGNLFKNMENSELDWLGADSTDYQNIFELKTGHQEGAWNRFVNLMDVINNSSDDDFKTAIEGVFDVDLYLKVLAVDVATENWDSYIEHGRNFYLYEDPTSKKFQWIPWDYNLAMGGSFSSFGGGGSIIENPAECTSIVDGSCPYPVTDPVFLQVINLEPVCCEESWGTFCQTVYDAVSGGGSIEDPSECTSIVDGSCPYPVTDPVFLQVISFEPVCCEESWGTFCQTVYDAVSGGGGGVDNPEECNTIVNGSSPYPATDTIFLEVIEFDSFCCNQTWDDVCQDIYDSIESGEGIGNGGGGGLGGYPIDMSSSSKVLIKRLMSVPEFQEQYYQYWCSLVDNNFTTERLLPMVENNGNLIREFIADDPNYMWTVQNFEDDLDQGNDTIPGLKKFIEERTAALKIELANLYNCDETNSSLNFNDLVINEFCASCDSLSAISDAAGEYDDWIEVYNNSDTQVDLSNAYLTDDLDKPQKWAFPEGASIKSGGYLIVWADNDEEQNGIEFHANFKLSKAGEFLMLMDNNTVLDSLSFGEQTTNLTASRIPNGIGDFSIVLPTFNTRNSETTDIDDLDNSALKVNIYPNPASGSIFIDLEKTPQKGTEITIFNTMGQNVLQQPITDRKNILPIDLLHSGIYILTIENKEHKVFYNQKVSIY